MCIDYFLNWKKPHGFNYILELSLTTVVDPISDIPKNAIQTFRDVFCTTYNVRVILNQFSAQHSYSNAFT